MTIEHKTTRAKRQTGPAAHPAAASVKTKKFAPRAAAPGTAQAAALAGPAAAARPPAALARITDGAVALSALLAGVGVAGVVGWDSDLARIGTCVLIGGTVITELAASRLLVEAQKRADEGRTGARLGALGIFAVLTTWNLAAGHMGMTAIDQAAVADKRAPLEQAAARASADRAAAEEALSAFDAASDRQAALWADSARAVDPRYVTAGTGRLQAAAAAQSKREAERLDMVAAKARAAAADAAARAALARAPHGREDWQLWLFAGVLELVKGAFLWACSTGPAGRTARRRRSAGAPVSAGDAAGAAPAFSADGVEQVVAALAALRDRVGRLVSEMSPEELAAVQSPAKAIAASAQHQLRRLAA